MENVQERNHQVILSVPFYVTVFTMHEVQEIKKDLLENRVT